MSNLDAQRLQQNFQSKADELQIANFVRFDLAVAHQLRSEMSKFNRMYWLFFSNLLPSLQLHRNNSLKHMANSNSSSSKCDQWRFKRKTSHKKPFMRRCIRKSETKSRRQIGHQVMTMRSIKRSKWLICEQNKRKKFQPAAISCRKCGQYVSDEKAAKSAEPHHKNRQWSGCCFESQSN